MPERVRSTWCTSPQHAGDDVEMQQRIRLHREARPAHGRVVEEPYGLASILSAHAAADRCLLVDCLTLWLTNLLCAQNASLFACERDALLEALPGLPGHIVLVSNETGLGVVLVGELTRRFLDESGCLHQQLASLCDYVTFTIAGLTHLLKGTQP